MKAKKKIGVVYDSSQKSKGHHGTHFSFTGFPDVEIVLADPNPDDAVARLQAIGAVRCHDDYLEMLDTEASARGTASGRPSVFRWACKACSKAAKGFLRHDT